MEVVPLAFTCWWYSCQRSPSFWIAQGRLGVVLLSMCVWIVRALARKLLLSVPRCMGPSAAKVTMAPAISSLVEDPPYPRRWVSSLSPSLCCERTAMLVSASEGPCSWSCLCGCQASAPPQAVGWFSWAVQTAIRECIGLCGRQFRAGFRECNVWGWWVGSS